MMAGERSNYGPELGLEDSGDVDDNVVVPRATGLPLRPPQPAPLAPCDEQVCQRFASLGFGTTILRIDIHGKKLTSERAGDGSCLRM
ncbi:hypothetical protein DL991_40985 [Amycolatopsis sp. WAC 01375]|nr:hypothetical protein DL991_40985 [Amycolatopsis sp. WAC 01375]